MNELQARRQAVLDRMEAGSVCILYSGIALHRSEDAYFHFEANRNFYYLTGINRENMILFLDKTNPEEERSILFIEEADPTMEKWYGKKLTKDEAKEEAQIENVQFFDAFTSVIGRMIRSGWVKKAYFDTYRCGEEDLPDYNVVMAKEFMDKYVGIPVENIYPIVGYLRMAKDEAEVEAIKRAVEMTKAGLEDVMKNLKPGMMEYQAQAIYEHRIKYMGSEGPSFPTIAGSGYNGTMLHYETNRCECKDGDLLLLDLGARSGCYCSDITRTYPVNGKYTERQKAVYDVVLKANLEVTKAAKPGMTLMELNNLCKKILAEGAKELGLIKEDSELFTYYMHGVSHHLGIDVHDANVAEGIKLRPGCVITNEPGLYIEEENIGIRIEDDLLITEDGCINLSKDIIRTTEESEAFMARK